MAEVSLINIKTLFDLTEIFRYRWDVATLACLGEGPMRFRPLARRLGVRIGDRVEDNALSRSLRRLRRTELITAEHAAVGRRVVSFYRLTDKGQDLFNTYGALVLTYQALTLPNSKGTAGQHGREARTSIQ
jgi:DNA-binding HxlR family transcriptional regulator